LLVGVMKYKTISNKINSL